VWVKWEKKRREQKIESREDAQINYFDMAYLIQDKQTMVITMSKHIKTETAL